MPVTRLACALIYLHGMFRLYRSHLGPSAIPGAPGGRSEYDMHQLRSYALTDLADAFHRHSECKSVSGCGSSDDWPFKYLTSQITRLQYDTPADTLAIKGEREIAAYKNRSSVLEYGCFLRLSMSDQIKTRIKNLSK